MSYLQNLHTHSTFCDGVNTPKEMIIAALDKKFDSIGFSGHSYMHYAPEHGMSLAGTEKYKREISNLKEKYKQQISIYCGLELDMYSEVDIDNYDYIIGSVHYFHINGQYVGFDRSEEVVKNIIDKYFAGDGMKYARAYYEEVMKLTELEHIDIVGHFDLITKHSEKEQFFDEESLEYKNCVREAIAVISEKTKLFELNTGAIARGYRKTPYLTPYILKELKMRGCGIVISSDCHDSRYLDCYFKQAFGLLKVCGFDEYYVLKEHGFTAIKLEL